MIHIFFIILIIIISWIIYSTCILCTSSSNPHILLIKEKFGKIDPSYEDIVIVEGKSGGGTYTLNKRKIIMCITNPVTKQPYPENVQMYVALHELAHVISKTYGHNDEFDKNFRNLLYQAQLKGVYTPISRPPPTYCV